MLLWSWPRWWSVWSAKLASWEKKKKRTREVKRGQNGVYVIYLLSFIPFSIHCHEIALYCFRPSLLAEPKMHLFLPRKKCNNILFIYIFNIFYYYHYYYDGYYWIILLLTLYSIYSRHIFEVFFLPPMCMVYGWMPRVQQIRGRKAWIVKCRARDIKKKAVAACPWAKFTVPSNRISLLALQRCIYRIHILRHTKNTLSCAQHVCGYFPHTTICFNMMIALSILWMKNIY